MELKFFQPPNKKSQEINFMHLTFLLQILFCEVSFFFLPAPSFLNQGLELRLEFGSLLFTENKQFGQQKNTILQNSLKRKWNHDAKTSGQLNHFYLDFLSQTLMIHRESEVRADHIQSFLPFSPAHKHSEADLQVCNF